MTSYQNEGAGTSELRECCVRTKGGKGPPCSIGADRLHCGRWYCHVHDPTGKYQEQVREGRRRSRERKRAAWRRSSRTTWTAETDGEAKANTIDGLMRADFRIGQLLAELRDGHLFNDDWTFGQYVQRRFDMGYRQAVRLIEAWRVVEDLELYAHGCPMPCCERSVRDLAQLPPGPERGRAWRVAVERAGGRRPTAALVREVVQSMRRPKAEDVAEFFRQGGEASA